MSGSAEATPANRSPLRRLVASQVLKDAQTGIMRWMYGPVEQGSESRLLYAGSIALLRAVGHVLDKVDAKNFPSLRDEITARYQRYRRGEGEDLIYTEFIVKERNLLLKEYAPNWDQKNSVELVWTGAPISESRSEDSRRLQLALNARLAGKKMHAIVLPEGPFEGAGFDELLFMAWRWWARELDELEAMIGKP